MFSGINQKITAALASYDKSNIIVCLLLALHSTILEIRNGYLELHAKSLVYTTLVSLVPVLAISFSLLQYFGVHHKIAPVLESILEPLGEKGQEIGVNLISLIDNVDVGLLGMVGVVVLLYTVISTVTQIEGTLNYIWKVKNNRALVRRIFYYLGVIIFSPILVFITLLLTASLTNTTFVQSLISLEPFGTLYLSIVIIIPYVFAIIAFTLVYKFLPNTYVSLKSAFTGAVLASMVWKGIGFGFAIFLRNSANYDAIYSGFAALIVFLLWLYISWLVFLLGAQFSYSFQNLPRNPLARKNT